MRTDRLFYELDETRQRIASLFAVPVAMLGPPFVPRSRQEREDEQLIYVDAMGFDPYKSGNRDAERAAARRDLQRLGLL